MSTNTNTSRKTAIIAGAAILLLAAAAYIGGRFMTSSNGPTVQMGGGGGPGLVENTGGDEVQVTNAEELPDTAQVESGIFVSREDNSIFIGTGKVTFTSNGETSGSDFDGPVVEVVITSETVVYKEITNENFDPNQMPEAGDTVQQKVELASIDDIEDNSLISVWGERRGDRIFATVVLIANPIMIMR